jgi:hypothetical protein
MPVQAYPKDLRALPVHPELDPLQAEPARYATMGCWRAYISSLTKPCLRA